MKVLVVGNGAREHALAWQIKHSPKVSKVFAAPGNAGMDDVATCVPIDASSIIELADFAREVHVGLTVVGPELPLSLGIVDEFQKRDLRIFGPTQAATELEASKWFAKRFLIAHGIPTAPYAAASSIEQAQAELDRRGDRFPVVIKADGLASGKGVFVSRDAAEARAAVNRLLVDRIHGQAGDTVLIEDFLEGVELSFQVVSDGLHAVPLASARDWKRLGDGDQGPNTGGMGSISPARELTSELGRTIMSDIVTPTLAGLEREGRRFVGVLYCGLMITDQGPSVLEFNARFGDPETQSVVTRLESDLFELMQAAIDGRLEGVKLEWKKEVAVSVVAASGGYPGSFKTGEAITGVSEAEAAGVHVFHAGTARTEGELVTSAGRVLTVTALAPSTSRAVDLAYRGIEKIRFAGMHYRHDIGRGEPEGD